MNRTPASWRGSAEHLPPAAGRSDAHRTANMQRRNALTVCAASLLDNLEISLGHAHELAMKNEIDSVDQYIEAARRCLDTVRALHRKALDEFNAAQGE